MTDATYADQFTYHPSGARASYGAGNGVTTTLTYDANRLWLDTVQVGASASLLNLDYSYDDVGHITGIADGRSGMSQTFGYDVLDRLTHAGGFYGPLTYTYDSVTVTTDGGTTAQLLTLLMALSNFTQRNEHPAAAVRTQPGRHARRQTDRVPPFLQVVAAARQVGKTTLVGQVSSRLDAPSVFVSADEPNPRRHRLARCAVGT